MHSKISMRILSVSFFLAAFLFLQTPSLEAGGWGKSEEVVDFEGAKWNGVFFDMNGLHFLASIPNYSGSTLQNGNIQFKGSVGTSGYSIVTTLNAAYTPPRTLAEFVKLVQEANPNAIVVAVDGSGSGAKYAVDILPKNQEEDGSFWRFLSTKDRIVRMGTIDTNETRRFHFFESIYIY